MRNEFANEILRRSVMLLEKDELQIYGLIMAQTICYEQRDNPEVIEAIAKYTELADKITGGVFSATLESWRSGRH